MTLTRHAVERYAIRTGRNPCICMIELFEVILSAQEISFESVKELGFSVIRRFKGDKYFTWYDDRIKEPLIAIVAKDGAVKTVMTKDIYSLCKDRYGGKERSYLQGRSFYAKVRH